MKTVVTLAALLGLANVAAGQPVMYLTDPASNSVYRIPPGGGAPVLYATGFNNPGGIAFDGGTGNLYVLNRGDGTIKVLTAGSTTPVTFATGVTGNAVVTDRLGNVYALAAASLDIVRVPAGGGSPTTYATGFSSPLNFGMAFDSAGRLILSRLVGPNPFTGSLYSVPPGGGTAADFYDYQTLQPISVAVTPTDELYVIAKANTGQRTFYSYFPPGSNVPTSGAEIRFASNAVASDSQGNVFYTSLDTNSTNAVYYLSGQPYSLPIAGSHQSGYIVFASVPEPSSLALALAGVAALHVRRRRKGAVTP
jgi:hypothetical protein